MKKLLNTLYITTRDAYLSKDGDNVVVSANGAELFRIPIVNIESICTFGYNGASPGLMKLCADNGTSLNFFTPAGRFIARINGPVKGNVLLRHCQYEATKIADRKLHLAKRFITGKIYNSRVTLRRFVRDYPGREGVKDVDAAAEKLRYRCTLSDRSTDMDELRGIEGEAARIYFSVFQNLILNPDRNFAFDGRVRRPPTDMVNAMLSMGYSLLSNDCTAALEGVGLDPASGFMHSLRPGRNSLALDLMEEMRSYIVDRLVLSLINNRQVAPSDFKLHQKEQTESRQSVIFTDSGLKKFLTAWQNKKNTEITHPFLNEKIKIGLLPHVQSLLLARYLRGDIDDYPVFFVK